MERTALDRTHPRLNSLSNSCLRQKLCYSTLVETEYGSPEEFKDGGCSVFCVLKVPNKDGTLKQTNNYKKFQCLRRQP